MMKRKYIDEAKFRDVVPQYMQKAVIKKHGENVLDLEVPEKNPIIPNVKQEITDNKLLSVIKDSIIRQNSKNIITQIQKTKLAESNIVDYLSKINVLKNINHNVSDEDGYLMVDEIRKTLSKEYYLIKNFQTLEISNNKTSLYNFLTHCEKNNFKLSYTSQDLKSEEKTINGIINGITNLTLIVNNNKLKKAYIYISDKPIDVLNMSVSCFFNSCQNLYKGSHNQKLTNNVFDTNMKVCYIIYDEPFIDQAGNKVNYTPLSRNIIRYIENLYNQTGEFYLDRTYGVLDSDLIKNYINNNLDFKVTTKTTEQYIGTAVKGLPLPYLDNLDGKFSSPDGLEIQNNTFDQALGNFLGVQIKSEPQPNLYQDTEGKKYLVMSEERAIEIITDYLWSHSYEYDFDEQYLSTLTWNEDNLIEHFDEDIVRNYINQNLKNVLDSDYSDSNFFELLNNNNIFTINDIIKKLYNGDSKEFLEDLKYKTRYGTGHIMISKENAYFNEYINIDNLNKFINNELYYGSIQKLGIDKKFQSKEDIIFFNKEKNTNFYYFKLTDKYVDSKLIIKYLLYTAKYVAKKENNDKILSLCENVKRLYDESYKLGRNEILDKSGKLCKSILALNIYLKNKYKKYRYVITFYLASMNDFDEIFSESYISELQVKLYDYISKNNNLTTLLEEYFDVKSFSNNLFTGKSDDWRKQKISNSFNNTDSYYEFIGNKINELAYEELSNKLPDYFYGGENYGVLEYDNNYYYVVNYR